MGGEVSQPSVSNHQNQNTSSNRYVNPPTPYSYVRPTPYRYVNSTANPVIYLKNVLAGGKFDLSVVRENKRILRDFMENLLDIMQEKDRDFNRLFQKLYYTGSFYENLRISDPNEFDINLILKLPFNPGERYLKNVGGVKSYMKYKLNTSPENNEVLWENEDLLDTLFEGAYLSPVKVRRWIQAVVDRAKPFVSKPDGVRAIFMSASGPAKTIVLQTDFGYDIDIDLVPVIQFTFPEWPTGARKSMLNTFDVKIEDQFWFLVPKEFHTAGTNVNPVDAKLLWRIHFPEIEKKIIHNRGQVKPLIRLLKALRNNEGWHILASYYLKTVVLWLVEENPSPDYWKEGNIYVRLIEALESLKESVGRKFIRYYFYPEFNLIQKIGQPQADNIYNRLDRIIRDIVVDPESLETYFNI